MSKPTITIKTEDVEISDGYHTFSELYEHRFALYIALCRTIAVKLSGNEDIKNNDFPWRAKLHNDGSCYLGWFILGLGRTAGKQITYHLPLSKWDETDFAQTYDKAPCTFDGHTPADVIERLKDL